MIEYNIISQGESGTTGSTGPKGERVSIFDLWPSLPTAVNIFHHIEQYCVYEDGIILILNGLVNLAKAELPRMT